MYVTGRIGDALSVFKRNPKTGKLTFLNVYKDGVDGIDGLDGADGITISSDGLNVYITGRLDNAVAVLKLRNIEDIKTFKLNRASDYESEGRRFESCRAYQLYFLIFN